MPDRPDRHPCPGRAGPGLTATPAPGPGAGASPGQGMTEASFSSMMRSQS